MPLQKTEKIWMDGKLVDWDDARIHILTHTLHYGCGVFEGIRAYATAQGPAVFRLTDHIQRLFDSAKLIMMEIPYTRDEIVDACKLIVRESGLDSCYVRPIAYLGKISYGIYIFHNLVPVAFATAAVHLGISYQDAGPANFFATFAVTIAIAARV